MSDMMQIRWRKFLAFVLLVVTGFTAAVLTAAAAGTFDPFPGTWTGTGTIALSSGTKERIRCRATYRAQQSGQSVDLNLGCQSDSYRFELAGQIRSSADGVISGTWSETTRNASGSVSGRARGEHIQLLAESSAFAADMQMTTRADRQLVTIRSKSGDIADVSITLRKQR